MVEPQPVNLDADRNITNPWQEKLEKQGLNFAVPQQLLTQEIPPGVQRELKTQLPIEEDALRIHFARKLSECIRDGKKWTMIYTDIDNLKVANTTYDRNLGDMVIRYGAATTGQALVDAQLSPNAQVFIARQAHAGDEITAWILDVSDDEIQRIKESVKKAETPKKLDGPNFSFSFSSAVISSNDERIAESIKTTETWLNQNNTRVAFNLFQEVTEMADQDVKMAKMAKDLDRLENIPEQELLETVPVDKFVDMLVNSFGNSRISDGLLRVLLKLTSAQTIVAMTNSLEAKEAYIDLLKGVGIKEEQIKTARTPEDLLQIFRDLFGTAD